MTTFELRKLLELAINNLAAEYSDKDPDTLTDQQEEFVWVNWKGTQNEIHLEFSEGDDAEDNFVIKIERKVNG